MSGLYPLKFTPIIKERIWGGDTLSKKYNKPSAAGKSIGESWEISGLQGDISIVSNGFLAGNNIEEITEVYMGDLVGESVYEKYGNEFPLLIKIIDAQDMLSLQVHPNDDIAITRHKAYGKTEMWYILESEDESKIYVGFNDDSDWNGFKKSIESKDIYNSMNCINPSPGEVFYIPAGRIHTIGAGIVLAEIQQASDITYRLYDWDRLGLNGKPRDLHIDLAKDVIDYSRSNDHLRKVNPIANNAVELLSCPYFKSNIIKINSIVERDYTEIDSFVCYLCTDGKLEINWENNKTSLNKGETVLIPAMIENIKLMSSDATLLEIYIDNANLNEE